jgi:hypothetical protein
LVEAHPRPAQAHAISAKERILTSDLARLEENNRSAITPRSFLAAYGTVLSVGGLIALVAAAGLYAIIQFGERERARDLQGWYLRLASIADGRAVAVGRWIEAQFTPLTRIADNQAVQLYAGEVVEQTDPSALAEVAYLRNLLVVTAHQNGFTGPVIGPSIPANVQRLGVAGLAILTVDGRPVVATPEMPPFDDEWKQFVASIPRGERALRDLYLSAGGRAAMAFAVPLYRVQGSNQPSEQIGVILGIKEVDDELFPLLKEPQTSIPSEEAYLVSKRGELVEYVSPVAGEPRPFAKRQSFDTLTHDASFAIAHSGASGLRRDYRNNEVLVTGRTVALSPWVLVEKVDRSVALADTEARTARLTIFLILALLAIVAVLVGIWRHGASLRARPAPPTSIGPSPRSCKSRKRCWSWSPIPSPTRFFWRMPAAASASSTRPAPTASA